jgi:uncharacterized protein (TIGR02594 family)
MATARKSTARKRTSSKRKSAKRSRGAIAAAHLGGIGDIETFTAIREIYDRLAESRGDGAAAQARAARVAETATIGAASDSPWMAVARGELGQRDYRGPRHNPRVIEYLNTTTLQANNDETSWCSAFVNWCLLKAGLRGTNNAAARSWLAYGQALRTPRPGCIVILWRESPSSWKGHVGFFEGFDVGNRVRLLGGNQGGGVDWDEVCVANFPQERILGYRWPHA